MITQEPTKEMLEAWKRIWTDYKGKLLPNRAGGAALLDYLQAHYRLTEIYDEDAHKVISDNAVSSEKLENGAAPIPRAFFLENKDAGKKFYLPENKDSVDLWGGDIERIFVGIDMSSGIYLVEGSTLLWDELCAVQGLDESDLQNFVCVAQYIICLKRFGRLDAVIEK